jgi:DNA repair protein RecN (Recombination protein N)
MHELAVAAEDAVERLRELRLDALRARESVLVDDSRLEAVERRLDELGRVRRRHGSVEAALEALTQAERTLAGCADGPALVASAERSAEDARARAGEAAAMLRRVRREAARALERRVTLLLRDLALPHARFRVVLGATPDGEGVDVEGERLRCGPHGVDEVEFRLAVNRDAVPVPLDEGPSGGELSRLALALAAAAGSADGPALVLDEVDTGIGGETAAVVGDVLATIARNRQVVAVTHRPEIAARARHHLLVTKRQLPGGPAAMVVALQGEQRLHEIARLMSGRPTAAALRRAGELLREGSAGAGPAGRATAGRRS